MYARTLSVFKSLFNLRNAVPVLLIPIAFYSCNQAVDYPEDSVLNDEALFNANCGSCHSVPKPQSLDKQTWKSYILPRMGYMLGFREIADSSKVAFRDYGEGEELLERSIYFANKTPTISPKDWERLQAYILNLAPQQLENSNEKITAYTELFSAKKIELPLPRPATTMVQFVKPGELIAADNNRKLVFHFNEKLELYKYDSSRDNLVSSANTKSGRLNTYMGQTFTATDNPGGSITLNGQEIINRLTRPVHIATGNLSGDDEEEIVVAEYGKWTGRLSWFEKVKTGYKKHVLLELPGAIKSEIIDINKDGLNDIVALFGQADEAIYIFYNTGNGKFNAEKVLSFPPTYGSTHFELLDFNKDGFPDIIYSAGDNGDYPPIAKPYHGVRIFLNNGKNNFTEKLFIPLNGVYKTQTADFDNDGDLDLTCISYFPQHPDEYFVYLENDGKNNFAKKLLRGVDAGQWLTMDSMDFDSDGDADIVIGAFDWGQDAKQSGYVIPLIYLRNQKITRN